MLMLTDPLPVNASRCSSLRTIPTNVRMFLLCLVFSCILARSVYSTIRVLQSNLLLGDKACSCTNNTGILAPAVGIRLSYHQHAEFTTHQGYQSLSTVMLQRTEQANRLNHSMINPISPVLSEIKSTVCSYLLHFCCLCFFFCPHPIFYYHLYTIALNFVFASTLYSLF